MYELVLREMKRGILIAIEGIDGSGKSTQSELLFKALKEIGYDVVLSHEPTKSEIGEKIRSKLKNENVSAQEVYELFVRDRISHVANKIRPALNSGKIVIVDRYFISTIAYQGASGIPIHKILSDHAVFAPMPDLVIILDIPVEIAIKRLFNKRKDSFEKNVDFLCKVREIYLSMKKILNTNIVIIDATRSIEEVHKEILKHVLSLISSKGG